MSQKIKNPNEKSSGFLVGIIALVVIVIAVIGGVVFAGRNQPIQGLPNDDVDFNVALDGSIIRLSSDKASKDAPVAVVYEDFSCHYCADLSNGGHADELKALNEGTLIVEQHTLNFLDGTDDTGKVNRIGNSTKKMALMQEIAKSGNAKLYWNLHSLIMEDQQQAASWTDEQLAERVKSLGGDDELVNKVKAGMDTADAEKNALENFNSLKKRIGKVSSPQVFVGDTDILQNTQLADWVKAALATKK